MQRRSVVTSLAILPLAAGSLASEPEPAKRPADFWLQDRRLRLRHVSGDRIDVVYWANNQINTQAWEAVSHFMRDRAVGEGVYMSPVLLDILYGIQGWLDYFAVKSPIILHSGYRDPHRNRHIEGAALNSHHITGGAADISIPNVSSLELAKFGRWLGGGGVGWYPQKGFVHLDVGRIRTWRS